MCLQLLKIGNNLSCNFTFVFVQLLSLIGLFMTPWTAARQASLSITNSRSLLKNVYRAGNAIQPSHPLLSPFPPTFNLSQHQGLFQGVSSLHQVLLPFHTVHGVLKARILEWFAMPPPVDHHVLSEFFTMTHLSWVALHGMVHSFSELR